MRGYAVASYVDDDGFIWRLHVRPDYAADTARGWATGLEAGLKPFPREWKPRIVVGIDDTGRVCQTRVGDLGAPLWTGVAPTFWIRGTDGVPVYATVIEKRGEKRRL